MPFLRKFPQPVYPLSDPHTWVGRLRVWLSTVSSDGLIAPSSRRQLILLANHSAVLSMALALWPVAVLLFLYRVRFLTVLVGQFGDLATDLDMWVKEGELGRRPKYRAVVWAYEASNSHLLDYYRPHALVVTSPLLCRLLVPLVGNPMLQYSTRHYHEAPPEPLGRLIQAEHHRNIGSSVLALSRDDNARGARALQALGMPSDAWFVCAHARSSGFKRDFAKTLRNVDIGTYSDAFRVITDNGGWVVRLGDPSMERLQPQEHVIDYAHVRERAPWLDIYLLGRCRFFLGCASGPLSVPALFGVPSGITNYIPLSGVLWYGPKDVGIPQLLLCESENRLLSFGEVLGSELGNIAHLGTLKARGISPVPNTNDEIKALAEELLDITSGYYEYSREDQILQDRFHSLFKPHHYGYGSVGRVGSAFLRKYEKLLRSANGRLD